MEKQGAAKKAPRQKQNSLDFFITKFCTIIRVDCILLLRIL